MSLPWAEATSHNAGNSSGCRSGMRNTSRFAVYLFTVIAFSVCKADERVDFFPCRRRTTRARCGSC